MTASKRKKLTKGVLRELMADPRMCEGQSQRLHLSRDYGISRDQVNEIHTGMIVDDPEFRSMFLCDLGKKYGASNQKISRLKRAMGIVPPKRKPPAPPRFTQKEAQEIQFLNQFILRGAA